MNMPFTVEQFFGVFESYNTAIWPAQIAAYALGVTAVLAALRGNQIKSRIAAGILACFWIWMGVVYHIMFFADINPIARLFGIFFVIQGLLLAVYGVVAGRFRFSLDTTSAKVFGALAVVYAMLIYPLLGNAFGHPYPGSPVFGVAPCPTTIFTFGILLWSSKRVPIYILIIPLLWSLVGTTAAARLQVPQDYGLGVAGVLGMVLIIMNNRMKKEEE